MRKTHPNLYKRYLAYALLSIALGLNFLYLTPTFMPLGVPKWPIGLTFLGCGLAMLTLLLLVDARITILRASLVFTVALMAFWAGALTYDFFKLSQTSMQLPIVYIGHVVVGFLMAVEPFLSVLSVPVLKNGNGNGNGE